MDTRNCECHGEPARYEPHWTGRGGSWRCQVARRERQLRYWHKQDGGYVTRRRRQLAEQRADVLERLDQLEREGEHA